MQILTQTLTITLERLSQELSEVEIIAQKEKVFELQRLKDVEGTAIFAGKKTEVIQVDQSMANLATNNARQIYSQIAGLNIYQNDDAGLQLNIGGRGLESLIELPILMCVKTVMISVPMLWVILKVTTRQLLKV